MKPLTQDQVIDLAFGVHREEKKPAKKKYPLRYWAEPGERFE